MREAKPVVQKAHLDIFNKTPAQGRPKMFKRCGRTRRMRAAALLIAPVSACGIARLNQIAAMNPEQLAVVSDRDVCRGLMFNRDNADLVGDATKWRLDDCSDAHFTCVSWGASFGNPTYVQCRAQLAGAAMTSQAIV